MADESGSRPSSDGGRKGREALWSAVRSVLRSQRAGAPLEPVSRAAPLPASFAQQRLWFLEQLTPASPIYNLTVAYRMIGPLSIRSLERGLSEILRRHEVLRTTLELAGGQVVQRIHPPPVFAMPVVDLRRLDAEQREDEASRLAAEEAREPFDFERPPLMRATLFRMTEREHQLILTMHHLAFDGWSFEVFMRELCALYGAFVCDKPSPLAELPLQYADYAVWQRRRLGGVLLAPLMDYWTQQIAEPLPVLSLPSDRPRNLARARRGAFLPLNLPKELTDALKRLSASEGATPFMTLLAAFQMLLYRYTGEEDVIVGSPVANRNRVEIEGLVGLFVNTLVLRTWLGGQPSFRELLARVRGMVLDAYAHQDLPFEMLVEALELQRRTNYSPIFQVMFGYQNVPRSAWALPGLSVDTWNVENGTAKVDVTLFMWEKEQGLCGLLEYDTDLFDTETMLQLMGHFRTLLEGIVRNPDENIAALPLLSPADTRQLFQAWNDTAIDYPRAMTIHRVFESQARRAPESIALVFEHGELTYAELDRRSNQLARYLQRLGVGPEKLVGVCLESSPALIVALLAILKAGAAYVPVDAFSPAARAVEALRRAAIAALVTGGGFESRFSALNARVVNVDFDCEEIEHENCGGLGVGVGAESLAHVMFTSGSTGKPKGVCTTHRGVVRLVKGANYADLNRGEVFLQLAPVAFDASTFEIWGALLNGAKLALLPVCRPSLEQIGQAIRRHRVSILWLTTGLFELWVDSHLADLGTVRQLLVGGDVLSVPHAERFLLQAKGCRLINCYGPTENTTFTSFYPVERGTCAAGGTIPIGRPVSNTQIYVLDPLQQPVPRGVAGEAYVGGDGLMRGYLDDAESTRERLIANPFRDRPGPFLYRTGDIVRHRRDGSLEFLGRIDNQVKIRGFRVEPGEVEAALGRCPLVKRAAVVAGDSAMGGKSIVAYVVPESPESSPGELVPTLRGFLRERLPEYLVPAEFVLIETIPLTRNGKLDRKALPPPSAKTRTRADAFVAPRDELERVLAQSFEQILGFRPIGLDDDFFEFGGSSLSALRLVAMIEGSFATSIPLANFYERATVAQLAVLLRSQEQSAPRPAQSAGGPGSTLVEIKRGRPETPFFLVPGGHGGMIEMTLYAKLMSRLNHEQSVYGLLAHGLDGENETHASVAEMAEAYLGEIRRLQPCGPYALGGECVGGVVAFEMAQQLLAQKQEVALLLLMDTWCPTFAGVFHYTYFEKPFAILKDRVPIARAGLADLRRVLLDHIRDRPPFNPKRWLLYGINVALTLKRVAGPWLSEIEKVGRAPAGAARIFAAETNYVALTMRYRPRIYPGRVTLLCSAGNYRKGLAKAWRRLARGGLTVHLAPGDHESYIRETPEATAELLKTCFDEAAAWVRHTRVPEYLSSTE